MDHDFQDQTDDQAHFIEMDEPNGHGMVGRLMRRLRSAMGLEEPVFPTPVALAPADASGLAPLPARVAPALPPVDPKLVQYPGGFDAKTLMHALIEYAQAYETHLHGAGLWLAKEVVVPPCAFPCLQKVPGFGQRASTYESDVVLFTTDEFKAVNAARSRGREPRPAKMDPANLNLQAAWLLNAAMVRAALRMAPYALLTPTLNPQSGSVPREDVPSDAEISFLSANEILMKSSMIDPITDPLSLKYLQSLAKGSEDRITSGRAYTLLDGPAVFEWGSDIDPRPDLDDEFMTQVFMGKQSKPLSVHNDLRLKLRDRFRQVLHEEASRVLLEYEEARYLVEQPGPIRKFDVEKTSGMVTQCFQLGFGNSDAAFIDIMAIRNACQPFFDVDRVAVANAMRHSRFSGPSGLDLSNLSLHSRDDVQALLARSAEHGAGAWFKYPPELLEEMVGIYSGRELEIVEEIDNDGDAASAAPSSLEVMRAISFQFKRHAQPHVWQLLKSVTPKYLSGVFLGNGNAQGPFCLTERTQEAGERLGRRLALWMNTWDAPRAAREGSSASGKSIRMPMSMPWSSILHGSTAQALLFDAAISDEQATLGLKRLSDLANMARAAGVTSSGFDLMSSPAHLIEAPSATIGTLLNYERRMGGRMQIPSPFIKACTRMAIAHRSRFVQAIGDVFTQSTGGARRIALANWRFDVRMPNIKELPIANRVYVHPLEWTGDGQCLTVIVTDSGKRSKAKDASQTLAAVGIAFPAMTAMETSDGVQPAPVVALPLTQPFAQVSRATACSMVSAAFADSLRWERQGWDAVSSGDLNVFTQASETSASKVPHLMPCVAAKLLLADTDEASRRTPLLTSMTEAQSEWEGNKDWIASRLRDCVSQSISDQPIEVAVMIPAVAMRIWEQQKAQTCGSIDSRPGLDQRSVFALIKRGIGAAQLQVIDRSGFMKHDGEAVEMQDYASLALIAANAKGISSVFKRWVAYQSWRAANPHRVGYDTLVEGEAPVTQSILDLAMECPSPTAAKRVVEGLLSNPRIGRDEVAQLIQASVHRICETHPSLLNWLDARSIAPQLSRDHIALIEAGCHASEMEAMTPLLNRLRFTAVVADHCDAEAGGGGGPRQARRAPVTARTRL